MSEEIGFENGRKQVEQVEQVDQFTFRQLNIR